MAGIGIPDLQSILDWISGHPHLAGAAVFLIAFAESLALVGLIMPGAALLFGIGALVAAGTISLPFAWIAASLGAFCGDGLSFWLGHHYRERLVHLWPLSLYPEHLKRGERFIQRHGVASIIVGRFVGPVRPIVPAVAGTLGMPVRQYLPVNIGASILWAPAYLLPGMLAGETFAYATETLGNWFLPIAVVVVVVVGVWWWRRNRSA